jgi:hypothetical protein
MINIIYLILLSDINLMFGIFALILTPYYIKISAIKIDYSISVLLLLFALLFSFAITFPSMQLSMNLLCMALYLFRYSFFRDRNFISPSLMIYILATFSFFQIFFPDDIVNFRHLIGDNRVEVVDYTLESLSGIRFSGIFTNPNYFGIVIIVLYSLHLAIYGDKFNKILNATVLFCVMASGSRAAFGCYIILLGITFYNIESARKAIAVILFTAIFGLVYLIEMLDLRFIQFADFLTNTDPSSAGRIFVISEYVYTTYSRGDYLYLLFGHGYPDPYNYFFDGDLGNLLHLFGFFGIVTFIFVNVRRFRNAKAYIAIFSVLPFIFAGGIYGNLKTLFVFAFIPTIIEHLRMVQFARPKNHL